jgi:hypothetical protein
MNQYFDTDQINLINKGALKQMVLRQTIDEALNNNPFNENYYVYSPPGLGKTFELDRGLSKMITPPLVLEGNTSPFAFLADVQTALYFQPNGKVPIALDDCDSLMTEKNINMLKGMFGNRRILSWNKANGHTLLGGLGDEQREAMEAARSKDRSGWQIDVSRATFIVLSNIPLPTANEVDSASTKEKSVALGHMAAIRRRNQVKDIDMPRDVLWGYVAHITMNEQVCEKFMPTISDEQKVAMLLWCEKYWDNVKERNISLIEKMTKDMVRFPQNYKDIWKTNYLEIKSQKIKDE